MHYKYTLIHNFTLILITHIFVVHKKNRPDSCLFVITKICTPEYYEKNYKQNYNSFSWYFNTIDDSHNKFNIEIHEEVCTSWFTKNFNKITYVVFLQSIYIYILTPKIVCLRMFFTFPKLPLLGCPQITINMNQQNKTKINKNSKFKMLIV